MPQEAYLLKNRQQKMPYKHIAIHLHKTELACRLHYHQMVSSKPRRETAVTAEHPAAYQDIRPYGLEPISSIRASSNVAPISWNRLDGSVPEKGSVAPHDFASATAFDPGFATPRGGTRRSSRAVSECPHRENVDLGRLSHVYADHRESFWSAIAEAYSAKVKVPPYELEAAFFNSHTSPESQSWTSPSMSSNQSVMASTPGSSVMDGGCVAASGDMSETPVHSPKPNRCTVSALLNEHDELPRLHTVLGCF